MRRLLRDLQENLEEFVAQDTYGMLVLGCEDVALAYVLKTLEGMDAQDPTGVYLNFATSFRGAIPYALESMAMLHAQREAAQGRRTAEQPPLPAFPAPCLATATTPKDRFIEAAQYLRAMLSSPADQRVVLGLLPTELHDQPGYAEFVAQLVPMIPAEPWRDAVRFVVRDDLRARPLRAALERRGLRQVLSVDLDLSNEAMQSALALDTADASVPVAERMAALLQLALLDHAYQRPTLALEKFAVLFPYYGEQQQPGMQALCQLGAADVLRALGKPEVALVRYRSGIVQAMEGKVLPVLLNLFLGAAECCAGLRQEAEAAAYFAHAEASAKALLNPIVLLDAMERRGDMHRALGQHAEAVQAWVQVEQGCRAAEYWERLDSVLVRQQALFQEGRVRREVERVEAMLVVVRDPARRAQLILTPVVGSAAVAGSA